MDKKIFIIAIFLIFGIVGVFAQVAGDFRSKATGNWSDYTKWERYNGTTWVDAIAGQIPTATSNVKISTNQAITVDVTDAVATTVTLSNSLTQGVTLTISQGNSLVVSGNIIQGNTSSAPDASHIVTINVYGSLTANDITMDAEVSGSYTRSTSLHIGDVNNSTASIKVNGTLTLTNDSTDTIDDAQNTVDLYGKLYLTGTTPIAGTFTTYGRYNRSVYAGSEIIFDRATAQTIRAINSALSYSNMTIKGTGTRTLASNTTVNGVLTMTEGTLALSTFALTYGTAATLTYNGTSTQTVGPEWTSTFGGSGGVIIANTSGNTITLNGAKVISGSLTINTSAILNTSAANNYALTLGGNFTNSGTFTANASAITINGTATQSIAGFTTTGLVSMTKTGGTATFTGNVNGGSLTINGSGGTLNLGTSLTHIFTGTWTRTNGTLDGGSSTLKLGLTGIVVSGTGGTFTASTGTVEYNCEGAQKVAAVTYYNLTISGSGMKTLAAAISANGDIRVQSGTLSNGGYTVAGTSGKTFEVVNGASFESLGTTSMATGFGTKTFGATSTVNYGGTNQTVTNEVYGHLSLSNSDTKTMPGTAMSIAGNFTTSGTVSATALAALTVAGSFTIGTGTTFTAGAFTHNIGGNWSRTGTFTCGTSTVNFNGTSAQSIAGSATTFNLVTINNAVGVTLNVTTTATTITVASGCTFDKGSYAITGALTNSGIVKSSSAILASGTVTHNTGSTIDYTSGVAIPASADYKNLTLSAVSGSYSLGGDVTIAEVLNIGSSTLSIGANTLTINDAISRTSGGFTGGDSSNMIFGGSGASTDLPSVTLYSLTLDRASGISLAGDVSPLITTTTNGLIKLGNFNLNSNQGNVSLEYSGTGVATIPQYKLIKVTTPSPTSLPSTMTTLTIEPGVGNTVVLPSNVTTTNLNFTNGSIDLGSHTLATTYYSGTFNLVYTGTGGISIIAACDNANVIVSHATPGAIPNSVSTLTMHNAMTMPNSITVSGLTTFNGAVTLGNYTLNCSSVSGTPIFIYNGTGTAAGAGDNADVSITSDTPGAIPTTVNTLTVDASGVALPNSVTCATLTMTSGSLTLSSFRLAVTDAAIALTGGTLSNLTMTDTGNTFPPGKGTSIARTWEVDGSGTSTLELTYNETELDTSPVKVWKRTHGSSGAWTPVGSSYIPVDNGDTRTVTVSGASLKGGAKGDTDYTISGDGETLPVELSSFTATQIAYGFVSLDWVTQSETGVLGFYIYRNTNANLSSAELVSPLITATNTSQETNYSYIDHELTGGGTFYYWLQSQDLNDSNIFHGPVMVIIGGNDNHVVPIVPLVTGLQNPYPNPFNPDIRIGYTLDKGADLNIKIYNQYGQMVKDYTGGFQNMGNHYVQWDGNDYQGRKCASGIYFIKMQVGRQSYMRKVMLLK